MNLPVELPSLSRISSSSTSPTSSAASSRAFDPAGLPGVGPLFGRRVLWRASRQIAPPETHWPRVS
jgi:hypothetical protein